MIIQSCKADNFASYKHIRFDFNNRGLTLVHGATGSGKSTLCDLVPWVLFGTTAKGGAVGEIIPWSGESTAASIEVLVGGRKLIVSRFRQPNDLYFAVDVSEIIRGKDLKDTQKLLEAQLGMTADLFITSSYFHEFSKTALFFTTTAKVRKEITEQIVDLTLAKQVAENAALYRRELKVELDTKKDQLHNFSQLYDMHRSTVANLKESADQWEADKLVKLKVLEHKDKQFDKERDSFGSSLLEDYNKRTALLEKNVQHIKNDMLDSGNLLAIRNDLSDRIAKLNDSRCKECGAKKNSDERLVLSKDLYIVDTKLKEIERNNIALTSSQNTLMHHLSRYDALKSRIEEEKTKANTYLEQIKQLEESENPHTKSLRTHISKKFALSCDISAAKHEIKELTEDLSDTEYLETLIQTFRALLVSNTVADLQASTNNLLMEFFDSEFRIKFTVEESDKIEVDIIKDGNVCSYTQLSKGQRQLLKLCFGISVMRQAETANNIKVNTVYFDEALDGFDDILKQKAYALLQSLQKHYSSIFVVEHNESLKQMFDNKVEVIMTENGSILEET